jgi:hypothetical protein
LANKPEAEKFAAKARVEGPPSLAGGAPAKAVDAKPMAAMKAASFVKEVILIDSISFLSNEIAGPDGRVSSL